jgi:hypothetical protein
MSTQPWPPQQTLSCTQHTPKQQIRPCGQHCPPQRLEPGHGSGTMHWLLTQIRPEAQQALPQQTLSLVQHSLPVPQGRLGEAQQLLPMHVPLQTVVPPQHVVKGPTQVDPHTKFG